MAGRKRSRWVLVSSALLLWCATPGAQASTGDRLDVRIGGWAENVTATPAGDLLVSNLDASKVQRIDPGTGGIRDVVSVPNPGGLAVRGNTLYVAVGNNPQSAVTGDGGVRSVDLDTGEQQTLISGLGEVNGLDLLPDGDIVFDVTLGNGTGVHRLDPSDGSSRLLISAIPTPNGLATGPDGQVYVGSTLTGTITRVDPDSGATAHAAGISAGLDDFGFLPDGRMVAATVLGQIDLIDPASGTNRPIASGLGAATSAKPAGGEVVVTTTEGRVTTIPAPA